MQPGGDGLAVELLNLGTQVPCLRRALEDRRGEFVAHRGEPDGHVADPLCGRKRERWFERCGSAVQGAGPEPDYGQVDSRERLASEPVVFALPRAFVVQADGAFEFLRRLASGACGRGERGTGHAMVGGLRDEVGPAYFQQLVVVVAVAGLVRVADGPSSGIGVA